MTSRRKQTNTTDRNTRIPLGVSRQKMHVDATPGKKGRWINDVDGRIKQAQDAGYEFRKDPNAKVGDVGTSAENGLGSMLQMTVGKKTDGSPLTAYYMEINQDWYDEDQAAKQAQVDETESSMRRGADSHGKVGDGQRYLPSTGIKIEHKTRAG